MCGFGIMGFTSVASGKPKFLLIVSTCLSYHNRISCLSSNTLGVVCTKIKHRQLLYFVQHSCFCIIVQNSTRQNPARMLIILTALAL